MTQLANGQILTERRGPAGRLGHIVLNRPRQLNALSEAMIHALSEVIAAWRDDDSVEQILLTGAGERGLSAGGDIAEVRQDLVVDAEGRIDTSAAERFLGAEYRLDASIGDLTKPFVAVMDGYTFGGGVGLSGHANTRVVTERSQIAMPEAAIGFSPDVGGSYLLANMPGELGVHAGITGLRLGAGDAIATGFADHYVPAARLPELVSRLETCSAETAIAKLSEPAPAAELLDARGWVDEVYASRSPVEIVAGLEALASENEAAATALAAVRASSPLGVAATAELVRRNRAAATLRAAIELEYRVGIRLIAEPDFAEGVRAMLIDKDRQPRWQPSDLEQVSDARIQALFADADAPQLDWSLGPLGR